MERHLMKLAQKTYDIFFGTMEYWKRIRSVHIEDLIRFRFVVEQIDIVHSLELILHHIVLLKK